MAYSTGPTPPRPGIPNAAVRRPDSGLSARVAGTPAATFTQNMKESHLRNLQRMPAPRPAQHAAEHMFRVAALMPDGRRSTFEHFAPRDLYLEDICARFARGTLIATPAGQVAIEDLRPGDMLRTRDNGDQMLRWIGSCTFPPLNDDEGTRTPSPGRAIRIKGDALGEMRPLQDLLVSARFRLLTNHASCAALFGSPETLAPALDILDGETILAVAPPPDLEFFNILLDRHQIISANGLETESYHPGNFGISVMSFQMQSHLRRLFVHLGDNLDGFGNTVRPILKGFEAEVLRVG